MSIHNPYQDPMKNAINERDMFMNTSPMAPQAPQPVEPAQMVMPPLRSPKTRLNKLAAPVGFNPHIHEGRWVRNEPTHVHNLETNFGYRVWQGKDIRRQSDKAGTLQVLGGLRPNGDSYDQVFMYRPIEFRQEQDRRDREERNNKFKEVHPKNDGLDTPISTAIKGEINLIAR